MEEKSLVKKYVLQIFCTFLALMMVLQGSFVAFASTTKTTSEYTNKTYTHQSKLSGYNISHGVDVSEHNGTIDFEKVKNDGIDFVFIRVGYTGYTKSKHSLVYDANYAQNIEDAIDAGLKVGVYWYSQALTTSEAEAEAQKVLDVIGNYSLTLPVVFDYEFADVSTGRLDSANLSKKQMTNNALAFLEKVEDAGYDGCLYANKSFLTNNLNASTIADDYEIWLAHYTTSTDYSGDYDYWQYSSSGSVSGISGNADVNFRYTKSNATVEIETQYYTGKEITPTPTVTNTKGKTLTLDTDYTLSYKDNIEVGTAYVTATGIGTYEGQTWKFKFKIIPKKVSGLSLTSRTKTSLTFEWKSVKGAQKYQVTIVTKSTGYTRTKTTTSTSYTIKNLNVAYNYQITVSAGRKDSDGTYVYGTSSSTKTWYTLPDQVTGLKVKKRTTDSVTLTWDKMGKATGYVVYKYDSSSKSWKKVKTITGSSNNTYTIKNLKTGSVGSYKVAAYIKDSETKYGKKSSSVKVTPKPTTATIKKINSSSKKKFWVKYKYVAASGYEIQWSTTKDFSSNKKTQVVKNKNTTGYTISTAQSNKTYYVRVRAYKTVDGKKVYGSWSSTKSIKVK